MIIGRAICLRSFRSKISIWEANKVCSNYYWFAPGTNYEKVAAALMALNPLDIDSIGDAVTAEDIAAE